VRSSKQDQIHASIVATLLALMDGIDSRGQVVVIGATNRPDAVDPALRRPGRFDREFEFRLPNQEARLAILKIHTLKWTPKVSPDILSLVSELTVGYCGADLKALCSEVALIAFKRCYPQVYKSSAKLLIDPSKIIVTKDDFQLALTTIIPADKRSRSVAAMPLPIYLHPLLHDSFSSIIQGLNIQFPFLQANKKGGKKIHVSKAVN
jgi:ATPase family AAA domain-containing protein 2